MRSQSRMMSRMSCSMTSTPQPKLVPDRADGPDELVALGLVEPGSGLVQQQEGGVGSESTQEAQAALVPVRESRRCPVRLGLETHSCSAASTRGVRASLPREHPPQRSELDVLEGREMAEQPHRLKGPRDAERARAAEEPSL